MATRIECPSEAWDRYVAQQDAIAEEQIAAVEEWLRELDPIQLGERLEKAQESLCNAVFQAIADGSELDESQLFGSLAIAALLDLLRS